MPAPFPLTIPFGSTVTIAGAFGTPAMTRDAESELKRVVGQLAPGVTLRRRGANSSRGQWDVHCKTEVDADLFSVAASDLIRTFRAY